MTLLPLFQTALKDLSLLQTRWKSILDPIILNPLTSTSILSGVQLINGQTVINHKLGRTMQGWWISDITGAATIYRSSELNALTLTLTSNAAVVVDIVVF